MGIGEELWLSEVGFRFGQLPNPMIRTSNLHLTRKREGAISSHE